MKFPRSCLALAALFLPSCFIYDESLLGSDDENPATGGSSSGSGGDGQGSGGDIQGSGGAGPGSGGTTPAGGGTDPGTGGGTGAECDDVGTTKPYDEVTSGVPYFDDEVVEFVAFDNFNGLDRNFLPKPTVDGEVLDGSWNPTKETTVGAVANWDYQQDPCLPELNTSLHATGSGFVAWGAGYDGQLVNPLTSVDVSSYTGVVFWARTSAATGQKVRIDITDEGGAHTSAPLTIVAGAKWRAYQIPFTDFGSLDETKVRLVHIVFPKVPEGPDSFDFWIDDPSFYEAAP